MKVVIAGRYDQWGGYMASKGSTDNLMDYPAGPTLRKHQWDLVHDPESMVGWFTPPQSLS